MLLANRPEAAVTVAEISEGTHIPEQELPIVLKRLEDRGLVSRNGSDAYRLALPPSAVKALDVLDAGDDDGGERAVGRVMAAQLLDNVSLAELAADKSAGGGLCQIGALHDGPNRRKYLR